MKTFNIILKSIDDVKKFINIVNKYDFDINLISGRYMVNAKSMMSIFSLDLSKSIKVEVNTNNCDKLYNELKNFII